MGTRVRYKASVQLYLHMPAVTSTGCGKYPCAEGTAVVLRPKWLWNVLLAWLQKKSLMSDQMRKRSNRSPQDDFIVEKNETQEAVYRVFLAKWVWREPCPQRWMFLFFPTAGLLRAFDVTMGVTAISQEGKPLERMTLPKLIWIQNSFLKEHLLETVILGQHWEQCSKSLLCFLKGIGLAHEVVSS